jgi:hypothetical protein
LLTQSHIKEFNPSYNDIAVSIEQIISVLGYDNETVPDPVLDSLEAIIRMIPEKVNLKSGFQIFNQDRVEIEDGKFIVDNQDFNCDKIIYSNLKNADSLAFIISTLGSEIESMSKEYMDTKEILNGYLVDKIGSELVEILADKTEIYLQEYLDKYGLKMTNRYSPGYCGWNVSDQKKLFSLLPDNFCNVTLNNNSLMTPIKSVSAVIGIGKNVERKNYQCSICDIEFCYKRVHNA